MNLAIRIVKDASSAYRASCPALPGCEVLASTLSEARSRIREAIRGYLTRLADVLPRELGRLLDAQQELGRAWSARAA